MCLDRGRQQELVIGAFFDEIDTDSDGEASVEEKVSHQMSIGLRRNIPNRN